MSAGAVTSLVQGAAALALALSFAVLVTKRLRSLSMLCAAQAALVAAAALARGDNTVVMIALAEAAGLAWAGMVAPPALFAALGLAVERGRQEQRPWAGLIAAAVLAVLATAVPTTGVALAIVLLGLLMLAGRHPMRQAVGIVAMQNGLVLAAMALDLSGWRLVPVVVPLLPAAAIAGLWLGGGPNRTAWLRGPPVAAGIDAGVCILALLGACGLPWWPGNHPPFWRIDARAAHVVLLLCALAAATAWAERHAAPVWGSRLAILGGTVVAVLSATPLSSWLGMALACAGASARALPSRAEAWRSLALACAGLGLALFGTIALHGAPALLATGMLTLGYGVLVVLAPELAVAAVALVLRHQAGPGGALFLAAGLAALLIAAFGLMGMRQTRGNALNLVDLAQAGVALFAFGLGAAAGNLAGLLQLTLLALTRCALALARAGGLDQVAALAGLAGMPPFGLFASLTLILAATAAQAAWLVVPLGAGLAAVAWALLQQLPAERRLLPSLAWLPLALALLCGFAMPAPLLAWFRLAAR